MSSIKQINIKNCTYYFFNHMINIKKFGSSLLKIDKKSYKNINIYYVGHITKKDVNNVNIHSVNSLYFIIDKADKYTKESHGNIYLTLVSTYKNKEI